MMETIAGLAGGEFNINSPKQLATVLFEKLGFKPGRKTKTGYSTDEDTLTQLATQHDLPAQIPQLSQPEQAEVDLRGCTARTRQSRDEAAPHVAQSNGRCNRPAFLHRTQSAKHSGEGRLRLAYS